MFLLLVPALILTELLIIVPRIEALLILAVGIWMALPGVFFARRALGSSLGAAWSAWFVGPGLGLGLSVFGLLLLWAAGIQGWVALVLAPLLTVLLGLVAGRFGGASLHLPALGRRDAAAVAVALLVVPVVTFAPYDHVRAPTADGDAYRAYFTADFVWAMAATAELAKGDVPPANPFLATQPMRYYWMAHLLSGAVYRNVRGLGVLTEQVVLIDGLVFGLAFVGFFYWLARALGGGPAASACAVAAGFLANSYEGADVLWTLFRREQPIDVVKTLNIDAITRWFYQGMPVDGLQRTLLYQPHHLTGYVLGLSALWLIGLADDVTAVSIALWAGILLGLAFLFSTFSAIIIGAAVGLLYVVRLVQQRAWTSVLQCAILGAVPVALGVAVSMVLGYTDPSEGMLFGFRINPVALRRWPYIFLLNFGPLLIGGLAGLLRWRWTVGVGAPAAALIASAVAFYFTADVPDMGGVWVGWRSGHQLLITFGVVTAAAATAWWQRPWLRAPLIAVAFLTAIPAVPTVAIDVYNAQDITNREAGPTFPWTLIITPPERQALDWIKRATPPDARVQVEPYVRDSGTWAYVPAFAERRMAAGLPISMIPLAPYQIASENVRTGIFRALSAADAHAAARHLQIDYLLIGPPERDNYASAIALMADRPDLFVPVFQNDVITIYGIASN